MTAGDGRLDRLDAWHVSIGTRRPHKMSFINMTVVDHVVVRAMTRDGGVGWGEASVIGGPYWSEESAESILSTLDRYLFPVTIGADAAQPGLVAAMWSPVRGNPFAKAALETALLDLQSRSLGIPLTQFLGGVFRSRIPLSWSLAAPTLEQDLEEGQTMMKAGHRIFKVKVGSLPISEDVARLRAIRKALGGEARLRADANQGWSRREAFSALSNFEELGLDFLEQPLRRDDIDGMALLQARTSTPLMADESVATMREAAELARRDAARIFSLKVVKHGGLRPAGALAAFAREMGIGCYVGCMAETSIGTAIYVHLAASLPVLEYGCELFGPKLLIDDLVHEPVRYEPGHVLLPEGPGLGVEVDVEKLESVARAHVGTVA